MSMQLRIEISVEPDWNAPNDGTVHGNLRVSENFRVQTGNFLETCQLLGEFNRLAEEIKERNGIT